MSRKRLLLYYKISPIFYFLFLSCSLIGKNFDLTIVGLLDFAGSLTRLPISWIDTLKDELKINFISITGKHTVNCKDVPPIVQVIAQGDDKTPGNVALLLDHPWYQGWGTPYAFVPSSSIKLALSMIEATAIPHQWVSILNTQFDAVVVPDNFLIEVYKNSGITIPIFVLPIGIYLEEFLKQPPKIQPAALFTFGSSAFFSPDKNHMLVIEAFAKAFANNKNVQLKIHGRAGDAEDLYNKVKELQLTNVHVIQKSFSRQEYVDFMSSLDCYVLLSKGEGFSITPREAMALSIPCILSDNTAHRTLVNTGYVRGVPSLIEEPANYQIAFGCYCGNKFNCTLEDAVNALQEVYEEYPYFLRKAQESKQWVEKYLYKNLKSRYLSLIKPKKVILGEQNYIDEEYIMTNSPLLYQKYTTIVGE